MSFSLSGTFQDNLTVHICSKTYVDFNLWKIASQALNIYWIFLFSRCRNNRQILENKREQKNADILLFCSLATSSCVTLSEGSRVTFLYAMFVRFCTFKCIVSTNKIIQKFYAGKKNKLKTGEFSYSICFLCSSWYVFKENSY